MDRFMRNAHSVPLIDLLTLNTLIILLIAYGMYVMKYDQRTCIGGLVALVVLSIVAHPYFGIPDNLSYYFGFGERPSGWRA